jgi:hypothetical protein
VAAIPDPFGKKKLYAKNIKNALSYKTGNRRDVGTQIMNLSAWLCFALAVVLALAANHAHEDGSSSTPNSLVKKLKKKIKRKDRNRKSKGITPTTSLDSKDDKTMTSKSIKGSSSVKSSPSRRKPKWRMFRLFKWDKSDNEDFDDQSTEVSLSDFEMVWPSKPQTSRKERSLDSTKVSVIDGDMSAFNKPAEVGISAAQPPVDEEQANSETSFGGSPRGVDDFERGSVPSSSATQSQPRDGCRSADDFDRGSVPPPSPSPSQRRSGRRDVDDFDRGSVPPPSPSPSQRRSGRRDVDDFERGSVPPPSPTPSQRHNSFSLWGVQAVDEVECESVSAASSQGQSFIRWGDGIIDPFPQPQGEDSFTSVDDNGIKEIIDGTVESAVAVLESETEVKNEAKNEVHLLHYKPSTNSKIEASAVAAKEGVQTDHSSRSSGGLISPPTEDNNEDNAKTKRPNFFPQFRSTTRSQDQAPKESRLKMFTLSPTSKKGNEASQLSSQTDHQEHSFKDRLKMFTLPLSPTSKKGNDASLKCPKSDPQDHVLEGRIKKLALPLSPTSKKGNDASPKSPKSDRQDHGLKGHLKKLTMPLSPTSKKGNDASPMAPQSDKVEQRKKRSSIARTLSPGSGTITKQVLRSFSFGTKKRSLDKHQSQVPTESLAAQAGELESSQTTTPPISERSLTDYIQIILPNEQEDETPEEDNCETGAAAGEGNQDEPRDDARTPGSD